MGGEFSLSVGERPARGVTCCTRGFLCIVQHCFFCFLLLFCFFSLSLFSPSPPHSMVGDVELQPREFTQTSLNLHFSVMVSTEGMNRTTTKFVWSEVFCHLMKLKADALFLQEKHLRTSDIPRWKRGGVSQVLHSKLDSKCRGAAILIGKTVQFISSKVVVFCYCPGQTV